eukprot:3524970-Rhodomonas_salina.1
MTSAMLGPRAGENVPLTWASQVGENVPITMPPARRTQGSVKGRNNATIRKHLVPATRSSTAMLRKSTWSTTTILTSSMLTSPRTPLLPRGAVQQLIRL